MTTAMAWRIAGGIFYAIGALGLIGWCVFLYLMATLLIGWVS